MTRDILPSAVGARVNLTTRCGILEKARLLSLFSAALLSIQSANSATTTFSTTGSWETASNWSPATVPNAAGEIIQFTATAARTVNLTGSATNSAFTVGTIFHSANNQTWAFSSNTTEGANPNVITLNNNGSGSLIYMNSAFGGTLNFNTTTLSLDDNLTIRTPSSGTTATFTFGGLITSGANPKNVTVQAVARSGNEATSQINFSAASVIATGGTLTISDTSTGRNNNVNFNGVIGSSDVNKNMTGFTLNLSNWHTNSSNGIVTLNNQNLYTGLTQVQDGLLNVRSDNGLGAGGSGNGTVVSSGGILNFNLTGTYTNNESISLAGTGTVSGAFAGAGALRYSNAGSFTHGGSVTHTAAATVNVTSSTGQLTLSGVYNDGGFGLTKIGPGSLVLSNSSNTITGTTQIKAGKLVLSAPSGNTNLNSSLILVGTSAAESTAVLDVAGVTGGFHIKNGQTLGGFGSILGNSVTIKSGGTLAPGNSIGTLTLNNALTLEGSSSFEISRNGLVFDNDRLLGITTLTYGGTLTVSNIGIDASTSFLAGDTWDLFDGFTVQSGLFSSLSLPTLSPGLAWDFDYTTGGLTVTSVPEPTAMALLGGTALMVLCRRVRRQS